MNSTYIFILPLFGTTHKAMMEQDNPEITVKRQAELLSVNRTSVYWPAREQRECE